MNLNPYQTTETPLELNQSDDRFTGSRPPPDPQARSQIMLKIALTVLMVIAFAIAGMLSMRS